MEKRLFRLAAGMAVLCMSSTASTIPWEQINGPEGGTVRSLAVIGGTILASSDKGIARSTNGGASWTTVYGGYGVNTLTASGNTVFAGTYSGIFSSHDSGASWTADTIVISKQRIDINCVVASGNSIIAGGNFSLTGYILQSTNGGKNWALLDSFPRYTTVQSIAVSDSTILAGTIHGIYRSNNRGASWFLDTLGMRGYRGINAIVLNGGAIFAGTNSGVFLSALNGSAGWTAAGLQLANVNSLVVKGNKIFAATVKGVFQASINGADWTEANTGLPPNTQINSLCVSGNSIFAGTENHGIFVSADNGTTWSAVNSGLSWAEINSMAVSANTVFAGTTAGLFQSVNYGARWTKDTAVIGNRNVLSLATDGSFLIAGTDNGIYLSKNNGVSWIVCGSRSGAISSIAVCGSTIFAGINSSLFVSTDNGANWTLNTTGPWRRWGYYFYTVAASGSRILAGTSYGIYGSIDTGASWSLISYTAAAGMGDLLAVNRTTVWATLGGYLYYSRDNGVSWRADTLGIGTLVYSFAYKEGTHFAGTAYGVYSRTDTGGMRWTADNVGIGGTIMEHLSTCDRYIFALTEYKRIWRRPLSNMVGARNLRPHSPISPKPEFDIRLGGLKAPAAIVFSIPSSQKVNIAAYDLSGREIGSLADKSFGPGSHSIIWDTRAIPPGCYVVKMRTGSMTFAKRAAVSK